MTNFARSGLQWASTAVSTSPRGLNHRHNKKTYSLFLDEIIRTFETVYDTNGRRTDGKILEGVDKTYISFMVEECPHLPSKPDHCQYFLRFSSKVSGHLTTPAEPYIRSVYNIAQKHFGSRVHFWHELCEATPAPFLQPHFCQVFCFFWRFRR